MSNPIRKVLQYIVKAFYLLRRSNTWSRCKKQSLICNSLSGKDRTTLTPNLKHYLFCYVCHFPLKRSILWVVAYISCMFVAFAHENGAFTFCCREFLFVCMLFGIGGLLLDSPLAFMSIEYVLLTSTFLHPFPLHIFSGCSCMRGALCMNVCLNNHFDWTPNLHS